MARSIGQRYVRGTVCAMVLCPAVFLAVYPLLTMVLPERAAILADLPQDLTMVLILDGVAIPLLGAMLYARARRRSARADGGRPPPARDTRDVY